jgi:hypothetical protein
MFCPTAPSRCGVVACEFEADVGGAAALHGGDDAFPEARAVIKAPDDGLALFSVTGMPSLANGSRASQRAGRRCPATPGWARGGQPLPRAAPAGANQAEPTSSLKCPSLRSSMPPPARCTIQASRMRARTISTSQAKNSTTPGMACPPTVLAMAASYPPAQQLIADFTALGCAGRPAAAPRASRYERCGQPRADGRNLPRGGYRACSETPRSRSSRGSLM